MNDILLYGSLGVAGLLLFLLHWRRGSLEGSGVDPVATALPPLVVVDRVFSREDLRYAQSLPKPIYGLFMRDRRALAMTWIRQIRYTTTLLMRGHVRAVRRSSSLHLWAELQIAAGFLSIVISCELFALAVVTLGPVRVKALIAFLATRIQALQTELEHSSLPAYEAV
jgi:hypothetical protein